ncbi:epoxide hydrolase family protein [Paramicrobacterium fandaimingii]|uniref:epoxide hydrolase family protein n=1 Tax=Paramicrobacterium fandaimingii TaxID=2708079 RepID=UPI001420BE20|nr:epoxide hydrolase family protein [Microbacterium fandaimingii]
MNITPFQIAIEQDAVDELARRISDVRWPNVADAHAEERGLSLEWLRGAAQYWLDSFDWRGVEARLNQLPQFTADVDGTTLHFVHARSGGDGVPVLLVHGWPDSFVRYRDIVEPLVAAGHDVIVPSLPGFLFSGQPSGPLRLTGVAEHLHSLMRGVGYERYAVSGGDWGSSIVDSLATAHPDAVAALHLTDIPFAKSFAVDRATATAAEQAYLTSADAWFQQAAYFAIHASEPTALATGLADSPVALLAWIGSKMRDWSDTEPELEGLLTQVSLHWFTNDARSALRLYSEAIDPSAWSDEAEPSGTIDDDSHQPASGGWGVAAPAIPTGVTVFPQDFLNPPREYAERFYDLRRYTVAARGGHFGATEDPEFFANELTALLAEV